MPPLTAPGAHRATTALAAAPAAHLAPKRRRRALGGIPGVPLQDVSHNDEVRECRDVGR
jgi:hypothetical protein